MELKVDKIQELKQIDFNYLELKQNLEENLKVYKNALYTEETIKKAKEDRAKLNKLAKAIKDKRIEIKKEVLKPYDNFEERAKELENMIGEVTQNIDKQIKDFETKQENEKIKQIEEFFEENAGDLVYLLNLDKIWNERWTNTTYKMKDIEADIKHIITKANQDLNVIRNLNSEFEDILTDYYFNTLNLTETMQEKTRLEEQKKKIEELKNAQNIAKNTQDTTNNDANVTKNVQNVTENNKTTLQQIDFRVWVTQEQKMALREFLIKLKIRYGSVK